MANLSIREAVKHFDVSRPTLANALKTGKLTGAKDEQGAWSIDPAEMARVYKARAAASLKSIDNLDNSKRSNDGKLSNVDMDISGQVEALREILAEAERRASENEQRAVIAEVEKQAALVEKRIAEALAEERKRILDETLKLLPSPAQTTPPAPTPPTETKRLRWWPF